MTQLRTGQMTSKIICEKYSSDSCTAKTAKMDVRLLVMSL